VHFVTAATARPTPLAETAKNLSSEMAHLREALEADNVAAATEPAHEVPELGHALSRKAYARLTPTVLRRR
jgi:hypothetical protein